MENFEKFTMEFFNSVYFKIDGNPTKYIMYNFSTCFILVHVIYIFYTPKFLLCTVIVNMCKTHHPSTDGHC